jgi:flagellar assembly factor FliW
MLQTAEPGESANYCLPETTGCIVSPYLGEITWEAGCELRFPAGFPGFEQSTRFVPVEIPSQRPLVYLQSADQPKVCFLALPVLTVCPTFELRLSDDDRSLLEFGEFILSDQPALGTDVLCLALLVPFGCTVQTNLDAPIVINLHNGRGVQAVSQTGVRGTWRLTEGGRWEAVC